MRRVSQAELAELEAEGAKVKRTPAKKPVQPKDRAKPQPKDDTPKLLKQTMDQQAAVVAGLAQELGQGQLALAEQIKTMVESMSEGRLKPIPFRFIIHRDKRGLMTEVEAHPILENDE